MSFFFLVSIPFAFFHVIIFFFHFIVFFFFICWIQLVCQSRDPIIFELIHCSFDGTAPFGAGDDGGVGSITVTGTTNGITVQIGYGDPSSGLPN